MDTSEPVVGLDRKIPLAEKLLFPALGGVAALFNSLIQFYLMFFYTNTQQIGPGYISSMNSIVPLIAAVLIPVFGAFIDRQVRRWGKYKPWVFITLLGAGVGAFLCFIPVNFGQNGTIAYATATYSIFCLCLAAFQAAFAGTVTTMTKKYDDRMTIAASSAIWTTAGFVLISYTAQPFAGLFGDWNHPGNGFQYYALVCFAVTAVLTFFILRATKERFIPSVPRREGFGFGLRARVFLKNKYALIAFFCTLILLLHNIRASINIYYCDSVFNDTGMMATLVLLSSAPVLLGVLLSPFVIKIFDLKNTLLTVAAVNIVTSIAIFFVPATQFGAVVLYVLTGLGSLFVGIAQPAQSAMIPFAADVGEWKYNISCGGFLGAVNGLAKALAAIILGTGILGRLILPLIGYIPQAEQSAATIIGIKCAMSFLPAAVFVILLLIVHRWDLTREKHEEIVHEIYSRFQQ